MDEAREQVRRDGKTVLRGVEALLLEAPRARRQDLRHGYSEPGWQDRARPRRHIMDHGQITVAQPRGICHASWGSISCGHYATFFMSCT